MKSGWRFECVEAGVVVLPSQESRREAFGPGVELRGQVLLAWDFRSVVHVRGLVKQVALHDRLRVFDFVGLGWEVSGQVVDLFNQVFFGLYSAVYLGVQSASFSHFCQSLVLISFHRVFEGELSFTYVFVFWKVINFIRWHTIGCLPILSVL